MSNIVALSLFNGIGGSFRCYDMLGIKPLGLIAFDTLGPAQRITSRRWPPAELHGDVRTIDKAMIERWMFKYPEVSELHIWGGFPCVDLSSVKAGGKGLDGPQSSLFFELPRIINLAKETVPKHVTVRYTAENVASMQKGGCEKITDTLGVYPYHLNCADAVPMPRPRLCWCSELLEGSMEGLEFEVCSHWTEVKAVVPYPLLEDWVEPGYSWPGGEGGQTLLTALKSIATVWPGIKRTLSASRHTITWKDSYSGKTIDGVWQTVRRKNCFWAMDTNTPRYVGLLRRLRVPSARTRMNDFHSWGTHSAFSRLP